MGALAVPFLVVNGIILLIGIIYYKKNYSLNRLFNFDVSKKITIITIMIILSTYVIATIPEFEKDEEFTDIIKIEKRLNEAIRDDRFTFEDAI